MSFETITYLKGNALLIKERPAILAHVVNNRGRWGAEFAKALSEKWKRPEKVYRDADGCCLEHVHFVDVENGITVANMVAQDGLHSPGDRDHVQQPLIYDALYRCLLKAAQMAKAKGAELHMPKIGAGLAKGDWSIIEAIIDSACREHGVKANVYTS